MSIAIPYFFQSKAFSLCRSGVLTALVFLGFALHPAPAQVPVINSVSSYKAGVNETVTINGAGFGAANGMEVWFGGAKGAITESGGNTLKVQVPAGATFGPIRVLNKTNGLSATSTLPFSMAFGGLDFRPESLSAPVSFPATGGIYDLQVVDLDMDGLSEAVIADKSHTSISIYKNTSTIGNISMAKTDQLIGGYTETLYYGDLDGDGKTDLIFKGAGAYDNKLYFVKNLSTPGNLSLAGTVPFTLATTGDGQLNLHDFDGDGKPELVLSQSSNQISIFKNQSSPGSVSFSSTPLNIPLPGGVAAYGLTIVDLDGNNKAEIAVGNNLGSNIYILPNQSSSGTIAFGSPVILYTPSGTLNLAAGDLDGDGKPDLALTNLNNVYLGILLNKTTSTGVISFGSMTAFSTELRPWGLQLTDIDGDGLTDVLVAHSSTENASVFKNFSTVGQPTFVQSLIPNMGKNYVLRGGDLDGDGKPEILSTDFQHNQLSILRNSTCRNVRILPEGSHTICSGTPFSLQGPKGAGLSYSWLKDGVAISGANSSSIEITETGSYTLNLTESADGCSNTSPAVNVTVADGSMAVPEFYAIDATCQGSGIVLEATSIEGATYLWTGPNGFSKSTQASTYTIPNATMEMVGNYQLQVKLGPCQSQVLTQYAEVLQQPQPVINQPASNSVCANQPVSLSLSATFAAYQWNKDGEPIEGATAATYDAQDNGAYSVTVTNALGCTNTSAAISLSKGNTPEASFENPGTICVNQAVSFINTTTATINQELVYRWDFGDGSTSTQESPSHTYTIAGGSYTVSLRVRYSNANCEDVITQVVNVIESEAEVNIEAEQGVALCYGESLPLRITGEASDATWSNGSTGLNISVTEAGIYTAQIQTTAGCIISRSIEIEQLPAPELTVSSDKPLIRTGESAQLQASGGISYQWSPTEGLNDPNIPNPVATPTTTTTYTVTAFNAEGCSSTDSLTIEFDASLMVEANKMFIPGRESFWKIEKIENYPNLGLFIMDRFGRLIYQAKPYTNHWDGWYKGKLLEEGVYYYVLKNEEGKAVHTGSITLIH